MNDKPHIYKPRRICLNCIHLCRLGNSKFKCTCTKGINDVIDLDRALSDKCENHIGVRMRDNQMIFYT